MAQRVKITSRLTDGHTANYVVEIDGVYSGRLVRHTDADGRGNPIWSGAVNGDRCRFHGNTTVETIRKHIEAWLAGVVLAS